MIPLRDTVPSRTYPIVTVSLIVANLLIFFYELSLGARLNELVAEYGLIPLRFFVGGGEDGGLLSRFYPFFSSMFLHGGWFHVGGNMLYLWIFGDNVEDRLGHLRYVVFYLLCGILAGLAQTVLYPRSMVPTIGASGAIAGVLGAYFLLYPTARVVTLVPIFFFLQVVEIPAFAFLFFWIFIQFLNGTATVTASAAEAGGGVAWWAHIGGFVAGMLLVHLFKKSRKAHYSADDLWL